MIVMHEPRPCSYRGFKTVSHVFSTLTGYLGSHELLRFAYRLGLQAKWIQSKGTVDEHFDLYGEKIQAARWSGDCRVVSYDEYKALRMQKRAAVGTA